MDWCYSSDCYFSVHCAENMGLSPSDRFKEKWDCLCYLGWWRQKYKSVEIYVRVNLDHSFSSLNLICLMWVAYISVRCEFNALIIEQCINITSLFTYVFLKWQQKHLQWLMVSLFNLLNYIIVARNEWILHFLHQKSNNFVILITFHILDVC